MINSLAPHVEVVLVGSDTRGKAVGQYAFDQPGCDARLRLVSFEILNGEGSVVITGARRYGRFTLCAAADDLSGLSLTPRKIRSAPRWAGWRREAAPLNPFLSSPKVLATEQRLPAWLLHPPKALGEIGYRRH